MSLLLVFYVNVFFSFWFLNLMFICIGISFFVEGLSLKVVSMLELWMWSEYKWWI